MIQPSGSTQSIWLQTSNEFRRSSLTRDIRTDVCVIGAGIAGLTTAYLLSISGYSVSVIEGGSIGSGETGRTTAHLSNVFGDRYYNLETLHGNEGARILAESHAAAIAQIELIQKAEQITCDFERVDGFLFCPEDDRKEKLQAELDAAHRAGLRNVRKVSRAPLEGFNTGECLLFPSQAQFHPLKYLSGLAAALERRGGQIYTDTRAVSVEDGGPTTVKTENGHTITSTFILVATNTPVNDIVTMHTKQAPYRTYAIGVRIPPHSINKALYWDTLDPYHYVRTQQIEGEEVLIVGGEDHKTGQDDERADHFSRLLRWTQERFPAAGDVLYSWSGQVMEAVDGVGFIGKNPGDQSVFIATGDCGNGMTHGTIAGILISDLIRNQANPWAALYDPGRINLRSLAAFTEENLNVAAQYTTLVTSGDVRSEDDVLPGGGAVIREGISKIAVYKDASGGTHRLHATCPHLGCIVAWNSVENTWDCPCHGSRFAPTGEVINGPAISGLSPAES